MQQTHFYSWSDEEQLEQILASLSASTVRKTKHRPKILSSYNSSDFQRQRMMPPPWKHHKMADDDPAPPVTEDLP